MARRRQYEPPKVYTDPNGKIPNDIMYGFMEGFDSEGHDVQAIKQYLLTEDQRKWLYDNRLDIADVLNGRTDDTHEEAIGQMFNDWNGKLGSDVFGF